MHFASNDKLQPFKDNVASSNTSEVLKDIHTEARNGTRVVADAKK